MPLRACGSCVGQEGIFPSCPIFTVKVDEPRSKSEDGCYFHGGDGTLAIIRHPLFRNFKRNCLLVPGSVTGGDFVLACLGELKFVKVFIASLFDKLGL